MENWESRRDTLLEAPWGIIIPSPSATLLGRSETLTEIGTPDDSLPHTPAYQLCLGEASLTGSARTDRSHFSNQGLAVAEVPAFQGLVGRARCVLLAPTFASAWGAK